MITHSGRDPGEKLFHGALAIGAGFVKALARNLNIEVPRADEPQRGWQINRVNGVIRRLRLCAEKTACEKDKHTDDSPPVKKRRPHLASVTLTACPSFNVCLPTRITGCPASIPPVI